MRVLITGSTGFIGSHLTKILLETGDHDVIAGYRSTSLDKESFGENLSVVPFDVFDASLKDKQIEADIIFHLATANEIISRDFEDGINISLLGTKNLLDCALVNNISKIVFFSTLQVYGTELEGAIKEETPVCPTNQYGLNHQMGEEICKLYSRMHGLDVVLMRPSNVYGLPASPTVQRDSLVPTCFVLELLKTGVLVLQSSGRQTRNFVSLRELNLLCLGLMDDFPSGITVVNAGSNLSHSILEVAEMVAGHYSSYKGGEIGVGEHPGRQKPESAIQVASNLPAQQNDFTYESKFSQFRLSEAEACEEFNQVISELFKIHGSSI